MKFLAGNNCGVILTTVLLHIVLNGTPVNTYEFPKKPAEPQFSRFKSLDRVINRLDGLSPSTTKVTYTHTELHMYLLYTLSVCMFI